METFVVDANPLIATLRGGNARTILFSTRFFFVTTEPTTWEVKKYIPQLSQQSGVSDQELLFVFERFPIIAIPTIAYEDRLSEANTLIAHRDPKDIHILALAKKFDTPLWSNDRDFENIPGLEVFSTAGMFERLRKLES